MRIPSRPLVAAAALLAVHAAAFGQPAYPVKPVRMIVPFPPGGSTDIVGRVVAQKLTESLGQQVVVENRGGAGGTIGTEAAARAPADGYTLLMSPSAPIAINVTLYKNLKYDTLRDFAPIIRIASSPLVLVVHPSVPVKSARELIAMLKARPHDFVYASAGNGTPQHLAAELFKTLAGVRMTHVPYKGSGQAIADVIAGQVPITFETFVSALEYTKSGRLRALAQTGAARSAQLPAVPTIAETGVRGYEAIGWWGLLAPAGTPQPVVTRLHSELARVFDTPEMRQRLVDLGSDPVIESPAQFGAFIKAEIAKWAKVIEESGAKVD